MVVKKVANLFTRLVFRLKTFRELKSENRECVVFGSGPSLDLLYNYTDFLVGKDLIGCNFVCDHSELKKRKFQMYSLIDKDYTRKVDTRFFYNLRSKYILIAQKNMYDVPLKVLLRATTKIITSEPFNLSSYKSGSLSTDKIYTGNSVPFLLQNLAKFSSYKTIYLFGVDHYPNHLNNSNSNFKGYKGRGVKNLDMSQQKLEYIEGLFEYSLKCCTNQDIALYNVTPNTHLEVIPKYNSKRNSL